MITIVLNVLTVVLVVSGLVFYFASQRGWGTAIVIRSMAVFLLTTVAFVGVGISQVVIDMVDKLA